MQAVCTLYMIPNMTQSNPKGSNTDQICVYLIFKTLGYPNPSQSLILPGKPDHSQERTNKKKKNGEHRRRIHIPKLILFSTMSTFIFNNFST